MKMAARLEAMSIASETATGGDGSRLAHYRGLTRNSKSGAVWTGKVALAPDNILTAPLHRKKQTTYFVNSMGDLFHESVPDEWIDRVFAVMAMCPQHRFQVLTKRSKRMREYVSSLGKHHTEDRVSLVLKKWDETGFFTNGGFFYKGGNGGFHLENLWLGVSAEDQKRADERIPLLLDTPAAVRFVSIEPMLGPVDLTLDGLVCEPCSSCEEHGYSEPDTGAFICSRCDSTGKGDEWGIDWIICGGESGPNARPMHPDWARGLRDQCAAAGVPFFFKQWGEFEDCGPAWGTAAPAADEVLCCIFVDLDGTIHKNREDAALGARIMRRVGKTHAGRILDGVEHNGMPGAIFNVKT